MFLELLTGLNIAILLIVLVITFIVKKNNNQLIEQQVNDLSKQLLSIEQQHRENLIVNLNQLQQAINDKLSQGRLEQAEQAATLKEQLQKAFAEHRTRFDERQIESLKMLHDTIQKGHHDNREQIKIALGDYGKEIGKRVEQLTITTENKLKEINEQVEQRLMKGFEKTNETFNDITKRLAMIDSAQKKITELSSNVVSLQEILNDKRSRGAFGEVQLSALVRNMVPESHFSFQHLLSTNKRPDCMLFLPEPTGNIAIDAKFPLENYRQLIDSSLSDIERQQAERQFKIDIKKHIQDIAEKYIIPGETADGAMLFIPAEAVFAEIHARHSDLVELAQKLKVWLVSPTTMMAILTTVRAVLKDAATRQQVHEIQKHLNLLSDDFTRFQLRMDSLAKRIEQTHNDVNQVHISSRKITQRFIQIEKADLSGVSAEPVFTPEASIKEAGLSTSS